MIIRTVVLFLLFIQIAYALAPCNPADIPDVCGILPSTYGINGMPGSTPVLCNYDCTIEPGFDRCRVCGGPALVTEQFLQPRSIGSSTVPVLSRYGSSVANWNGTVAIAQSLNTDYSPLVVAPIITLNLNHTDMTYFEYHIPFDTTNSYVNGVLPGTSYALVQSENYLVIGAYSSSIKTLQLWVRTPGIIPWKWSWTAFNECPGTYFGFSVAIDENIPHSPTDGIFGTVITGDPNARFSGRVFVYQTPTAGLLQELWWGTGTETTPVCYGDSVSADSGYLAVGAPSVDYASQTAAGSVFVYLWDPYLGFNGLYDNVTFITIPPPVPTYLGGFGESVSVSGNFVMIGDNQRRMYMYRIVGLTAIPVILDNPVGFVQESRFGYEASVWNDIALAGDEEYIPVVGKRGITFAWTINPLAPTAFRPTWTLMDDSVTEISTRYGAAVDARGGCLVAIGTPQYSSVGGVYVVNLCDVDCYGCDDVLNSCTTPDFCGVCVGDNSTCIGCDGIINSGKVNDLCGVCDGNSTTCIVVNSATSFVIACNGTFTTNITHVMQSLMGPVHVTGFVLHPSKGNVVYSGATVTYTAFPFYSGTDTFTLTIQAGSVIDTVTYNINMGSCPDCLGILSGPNLPDPCGVCGGNGSTCLDCFGIPNGGAVYDDCGVCDGQSNTCLNIVQTVFNVSCTGQIIEALTVFPYFPTVHWTMITPPTVGTATINPNSGVFVYNNPGTVSQVTFVVQASLFVFPFLTGTETIILNIDNSSCIDCSGSIGFQLVDLCGVCGGNSRTCADCAGVPYGNHTSSVCNQCYLPPAYGGSLPILNCLDCLGVPYGNTRYDNCNPPICGGDGSTCMGASSLGSDIVIFFVIIGFASGLLFWYFWVTIVRRPTTVPIETLSSKIGNRRLNRFSQIRSRSK